MESIMHDVNTITVRRMPVRDTSSGPFDVIYVTGTDNSGHQNRFTLLIPADGMLDLIPAGSGERVYKSAPTA
jgi:hypothetical protein